MLVDLRVSPASLSSTVGVLLFSVPFLVPLENDSLSLEGLTRRLDRVRESTMASSASELEAEFVS